MKAVTLVLALAVITGCNARVLPAPEPWQQTIDRFNQYLVDLNEKAGGVVESIKASQVSRELDTLITDTMAELNTYKESIEEKMGPYTDVSTTQMSQDLQLLFNKLQDDMIDAKERSTEYLGELKTMVEQNADDVRNRVNLYVNKLSKRLNKDVEDIRSTVATYMGELHSRTSQNMETVRGHVEPYVHQARGTASEKLGALSELLKTQAEGLGHQLETQADVLRTQLEDTAQNLRTSLEGKIDELTDLFSPYATRLREQFEDMVEKVKETIPA